MELGYAPTSELRQAVEKFSRRKPLAAVTIKLVLDWNPCQLLQRVDFDFKSPENIKNMLRLTGTLKQALALTVAEYMSMVWPGTWEPLVELIIKLITIPEGHMCVSKLQTIISLLVQMILSSV